MDSSFVGRSFRLAEPYVVGVEKVREFAEAIGEASPLCHDRDAARAAGYRDVVAPPTFAMSIVSRAQELVLFDPELGLDFSRVVHGDQGFTHHRAMCAGDELNATVHIDAIREMAGNDIITLRTEVIDDENAPVVTATSTLVSRGVAS